MAQPEGQLSSRIIKWLNSQPATTARKRHVTIYGKRGDPDIYGCVYTRHFEIETKLPGNTSTKNQESMQRDWMNAGAFVREVHSLQEAKDFYHEIVAAIPEREKF